MDFNNGLRPKLFKEELTMDASNPLVEDEWTTADIDWMYFSSIVKPTIVSHTKRVVNDNGKEDFNPAQKK